MAAGITSSVSGSTTTYVITDQAANTLTIAALARPGGLTFTSSGALLADGQIMAGTLITMLTTGLRPNVMVGTVASFTD